MHSIRLVYGDSYQASPIPDVDPTYSQFRGCDIKQVPIIRIFGITLAGEKVCLHVHGVFPYMYVPYSGHIDAEILVYRLATSIDAALNASFGPSTSSTQHVYKIQQVSGIPFYGYHKRPHHFLKIYFYNPAMMKRATDLLQNGSILDQIFQPHEAHIPFILQFMIDYNIYGMSFINFKNVKYRRSFTNDQNEEKLLFNLNQASNSDIEEKEYLPFSVAKQSVCKLEMDAWASDILNREIIDKGIDLNPGIAAIWEEEKARRMQVGLQGESQLTYPSSPERSPVTYHLLHSDTYYEKRIAQRLCSLDSQNDEALSSPSQKNSTYPIPIANNTHLLNASQLEIHVGSLESTSHQKFKNTNESLKLSFQPSFSLDDVSLSSNDYKLVDILVNLAEDQENISNSIDCNSILGSQKLETHEKLSLKTDKENFDEEEEELENLNITSIELDSLNLSQWENYKKKSQSNEDNNSQIELALESLKESQSYLTNNIPQFDGPIDDENATTSNSSVSANVTIERKEFISCEYKKEKQPVHTSSVTPKKRKHLSCSTEYMNRSVKKKKVEDYLPKTPRRSPSAQLKKITSPSCPSRNYSPLKIEITNAQKTETFSPCTSPSTSYSRQKIRGNLRPKRILTALKEYNAEDESPSIDLVSKKIIKETSEKPFAHKSDADSDSDKTLVEDSDDSFGTVRSFHNNPAIIDETDSNDTMYSKQRQSNISSSNSSNSKLSENETNDMHEISFTPFIEISQQTFSNQNSCEALNKDLNDCETITSKITPLNKDDVISSLEHCEITKCNNVEPFFSEQDNADAMHHDINISLNKDEDRKSNNLESPNSNLENVVTLDECQNMNARKFPIYVESLNLRQERFKRETITIRPLKSPPDRKSVVLWMKEMKKNENEKKKNDTNKKLNTQPQDAKDSDTSSIFLFTPSNASGSFKSFRGESEASKHLGISCGQIEFNSRPSSVNVEHGNLGNAKALTTVHVITRSNLLPDPQYDAVEAVFYAIYNDVPPDWSKPKPLECGVVIVKKNKVHFSSRSSNFSNTQEKFVSYVENENELFNSILSIIERSDPDILIGWDLDFLSWGYMFQRASKLGRNLSSKISRIPVSSRNWKKKHTESSMEIHLETLGDVTLVGRIVLDIWRLMRHEIALTSYTYENVMFHVMNERIPHPSFEVLTKWWNTLNCRWRVIDHYINKVIGVHRILHHLDIVNRTSEHARLYGIQFYEVFSRGSQYRVESMMLRLAKPLNYIPISPSAQQRSCMRAPESLPLILEPESTLYCDPVVVLDFQSLYPSIIIAYNYCFSTCLGRVERIGSEHPFEFGAATLKVDKKTAKKLKSKMNFAPCGVAFVKKEVRQGILPRMLTEILETRLMVKKAIKDHSKEDRALQRALDSRQLGLKLIANVTYGYTAANFSGRMPCIEVGDSVVSKGRETLEGAIKMVESTSKWGARVVYGDTDSLFVLLKGRSREDAFIIGAEIAETVTAANPKPVKLKFEKVMQPCILQTKKRYCGYVYEHLNDKPVYLGKGLETVRRDGCPAVVKILEKSLRILFDTKDLCSVKEYVTRQLDKILTGRASIQDLIFAKEFRGMKGYKPTACVPALELTKRLIKKDPRAVPRTGSRVPYVIVAGGPNEPLIHCVRSPMEVILNNNLRPNAIYYITKVIIPALNRCLNLIGVDAYSWFMEMPHRQSVNRVLRNTCNVNQRQKTTISQYLCNTTCPCCGKLCDKGICKDCIKNQRQTLVILYEKCRQLERIYFNIKMMCESCIGFMDANSCTSLDCPIFYRRAQAQIDNTEVSYLYNLIQCMNDSC